MAGTSNLHDMSIIGNLLQIGMSIGGGAASHIDKCSAKCATLEAFTTLTESAPEADWWAGRTPTLEQAIHEALNLAERS
jgi:hypothetical protein